MESFTSVLVRHCFLNIERSVGPLTSVPISPVSLRNASVACLCHLFIPMSHVEFKKWPCRMTLYCLDALSHVNKLNNVYVALSALGVNGHHVV